MHKSVQHAIQSLQWAKLALEHNPEPAERERIARLCEESISLLGSLPSTVDENAGKAGASRTERKAASSAENGKKGGRPRKSPQADEGPPSAS